MRKSLVALGLAPLLVACTGCVVFTVGRGIAENVGLVSGHTNTAWEKIDAGALLIDVRSPQEYEAAHVDGAINIPHNAIADKIGEVAPDKDTQIVVYCRAGHRAAIAEDSLRKLGYTNVFNGGGYAALARPRE